MMLQILNDEEYIMIADLSRNFENVDNGIRFLQSDGGNPDFVELCHELDIFLNELQRNLWRSQRALQKQRDTAFHLYEERIVNQQCMEGK